MRKILRPAFVTALAFVFLNFPAANAQTLWVGAGGSYNATWLLNKNVNDQGDNLNPAASGAPAFGLMANYLFNNSFGVVLEANLARIDQRYSGTGSSGDFDARTKTSWMDIPLLILLKTQGGVYLELGPQFSFLNKVTETVESNNSALSYTDKDFTDNFNNTVISGVFGFGGLFPITETVSIKGGLRLQYGLTDAINELSESEFTTKILQGKLGIPAAYAHLDQNANFSFEPTNAISAGIRLGIVFRLAGSN